MSAPPVLSHETIVLCILVQVTGKYLDKILSYPLVTNQLVFLSHELIYSLFLLPFLAKTSKYFIDYMWKLTKNEHNEPGKRFPGWLGPGQEPGNTLTVSQFVTRLSFAHFGTNINAVNVTVNTPNNKQLFNWSNIRQSKNVLKIYSHPLLIKWETVVVYLDFLDNKLLF